MISYVIDLIESRLKKIDVDKYVLAYSGGRDSHLLLELFRYFNIKVEVVAINTYLEFPEILERINKNADKVLLPKLKPFDIKKKYGSPCFSKHQDEYIERYQRGLRSENCLNVVNRKNVYFNLSKKASDLLLNDKLHKISNKCCNYLKKKPMNDYLKKVNKKVVLGVRQSESNIRKNAYKSCFSKNGTFTPLFDVSNEEMLELEKFLKIEVPKIYNHLSRTGCIGCPYGKNFEKELELLENSKRKEFIKEYFKESYKIKKEEINMTVKELLQATKEEMQVRIELESTLISDILDGTVREILKGYDKTKALDLEVKYIDRYWERFDMCIYTK